MLKEIGEADQHIVRKPAKGKFNPGWLDTTIAGTNKLPSAGLVV